MQRLPGAAGATCAAPIPPLHGSPGDLHTGAPGGGVPAVSKVTLVLRSGTSLAVLLLISPRANVLMLTLTGSLSEAPSLERQRFR